MTENEQLLCILGATLSLMTHIIGCLAVDCANLRAEQAERGKRQLLTCWRCGHKEKRLVCDCEKMNWEGGDPTLDDEDKDHEYEEYTKDYSDGF